MTPQERLAQCGAAIPEILIPNQDTNPEQWAVIACDQFSSERAYWEDVAKTVGDAPSTLNLIIPECYLEDGDKEERVNRANASMEEVLSSGALKTLKPGFVLVNRSTPHAPSRKGLVIAVDLEAYDFAEGSKSAIRPTEGTIRDRLPPRMDIRRDAGLDLPHILLLIDDPEDSVMKAAEYAAIETVYDFDLMQNGGHIQGQFIPEEALAPVAQAFQALATRSNLIFAVGDGNHSLASAREIWREKKAAGAPMNHPARYALAEVENIHDAGMHFHPIHRVLFGVNPAQASKEIAQALQAKVQKVDSGAQSFGVLGAHSQEMGAVLGVVPVSQDSNGSTGGGLGEEVWSFPIPQGRLSVEPLQDVLDDFLSTHPEASIDYIHGDDAVRELTGAAHDRLGIILPELDKNSFFTRITDVGPYPRKTFSIGEAVEKRYYLEARVLKSEF